MIQRKDGEARQMDIEKEIQELKAQITPMNTFKFIAGTLISLGATAAVIGMMKSPLNGSKGVTKLLMKLGIFVLACKAGDVAEDYFKKTADEAEKAFKEAKDEVKGAVEANA